METAGGCTPLYGGGSLPHLETALKEPLQRAKGNWYVRIRVTNRAILPVLWRSPYLRAGHIPVVAEPYLATGRLDS